MPKLTIRNSFGYKDQMKADISNKFIGRGSAASSTNQYAKDYGDKANTGNYVSSDVVFISAEGNRTGRLVVDFDEIRKAILAEATLVADNPANRNRAYNTGERDVANFLRTRGCTETIHAHYSTWKSHG